MSREKGASAGASKDKETYSRLPKWFPTLQLRWDSTRPAIHLPLQQLWCGPAGIREWRDVPMSDEGGEE